MKKVIDGVVINGYDTFEEARREYLKTNNVRLARKIDLSKENSEKTKKHLKEKANNTKTYTRYGNIKKNMSYSKYEEQCLDNAYKRYEKQYLDILNTYIPKNDYICPEEWLSMLFYVNKVTFATFEGDHGIYLLSLPVAIHIADVISENDKMDELKKILKDVQPTELDDITDTVHDMTIIKKLVTVIQDRNKDHKKYVKDKEHFGEYSSHENEPKYNLFKSVISLIDKDYIQKAIDDVEALGIEVLHNSLKMVEKPIQKHIELAEKADNLLDSIINYEVSKAQTFNPVLNPQNVINNINATNNYYEKTKLAFGMLNRHCVLYNEAAEIGNECLDIILKYAFVQNFLRGPAFVDSFYHSFKSEDLNIRTLDIQNPYYSLFGILMAVDRNEIFMHVASIYHQVLFAATYLLPWQIDCANEIRQLVIKSTEKKEIESNDINNGYVKYIKSRKENDTETSMNMPQIIYGLTGVLLPRTYLGSKTYSELLDNFEVDNHEYVTTIMSLLTAHKESVAKIENDYEEKYNKVVKEVESKYTENKNKELSDSIAKLKKELNDKVSEGYRLSSERDDFKEKYENLKVEYENDMKELAQLREYMFNLQHEEDTVEEDLDLPINLKKRTLVFGGHDNWVGRLKEALHGDIKYYPPKYSKSNELIANADIVYIQIKYISHTTYYWVIEHCKKLGVPFVCLNSSSSNICIKTIAENDRL